MINKGDKVSYLGVSYIVVDSNEFSVTLTRENAGSIELVVNKGSQRFKAIFPNEVKEVKTFAVVKDVKPQIYKEFKKLVDNNGIVNIDYNGKIAKMIERYSLSAGEFYNSFQAKQALDKDLKADKTGFTRFVFSCVAERNNATKFDFLEVIDWLDNHKHSGQRPESFDKRLLDFYLSTLQDDNEATDEELDMLCNLIPINNAADYVECICGCEWLDIGKLIMKAKDIREVLDRTIDQVNEIEDLTDLDNQVNEIEDLTEIEDLDDL